MKQSNRISRRKFLLRSGAAVGAAGAGTLSLGFTPRASAGVTTPTIVYVFLRGGMDGLSFIVPIDDGAPNSNYGQYMSARSATLVDINDSNIGERPLSLDGLFGIHPFCSELHTLFAEDRVAIIQAAGHPPGTETRSHFDAQEQIELGTPGEQSTNVGWLTRHLSSTPTLIPDSLFTAMVANSSPPISLSGWSDIATLDSTSSFRPNSGIFGETQLAMLSELYAGNGELDLAGGATLDAIDLVASLVDQPYVPAGGVTYPNTSLGDDMQLIAQLIRQDLGVATATVDFGGWDTHNLQNVLNINNGYGQRVNWLSEAIDALYRDLAASGRGNDVTIVVQSEFGRQVKENADFGTDHGLGNPMLVIGGRVNGGLYGSFPGLAISDRLNDSVRPTTDFRNVLAEVVMEMADNPNIDQVFPGLTYQPLGFSQP